MKAIYFFRNDFRLKDNETLSKALNESKEITFIVKAPLETWGHWRKKFYSESLLNLKEKLKSFGHELYILTDNQIKNIPFTEYDVLYTPLINASYEKREEKALSKEIQLIASWNDRLIENLPYSNIKDLPNIFTEFRKKIEKGFTPKTEFPLPNSWPKTKKIDLKSVELSPFDQPHKDSAFPFLGGEDAAWERLQDYFFKTQNILTYKETRNGLIGLDYSTKFSPYLALGCISARSIYRMVEEFENQVKANQDTYWVKFELWWREYFRWVYEKFPERYFSPSGLKEKLLFAKDDQNLFEKWKRGKTGDDFVDANMIELRKTGWMSNRGRQNVASYLVKDLELPWIWGANYFENELIDYDVFSNWGNWLYVAGVGNDPRPNRYFNTQKQAGMYDGDFSYRHLWLRD